MVRLHFLVLSLALAWASLRFENAAFAGKSELTLEDVIRAAQTNALARMARAKTRADEAQVDEADGKSWASLEATSFLAPSPRIECDNPDCTQTSPDDLAVNVAGLFGGITVTLTQPLYTGGKLSAIQDAARKAAGSSRALEDQVAGELAMRSAQAYFGLKLAREVIVMLEDGAEHMAKGKETLESKLAEGAADVTLQDRFRLATLQAEVEAMLSEAREAEAVALAALRALTGDAQAEVDASVLEAVSFSVPGTHDGTETSMVRAARLGLESRHALVDFETSQYFPDFVLIGGANYAAAQGVDNPPSAFANDRFNTSSAYVALGLRWRLDPLAQPARVARRRAEEQQASALLEAASASSTMAWQQAVAKAQETRNRLQAAQRGEKSGRAWVASVLQADAVGAASAKDLADAYLAYFTQRGRMLRSTHDWNLATVELRRLSGEFSASH